MVRVYRCEMVKAVRAKIATGGNRTVLASLGQLWCRTMHNDVAWPAQGHYRCRRCNRIYEVPWSDTIAASAPEDDKNESANPVAD